MKTRKEVLEIVNDIRQSKDLAPVVEIHDEDRLREDLSLTSFDLAELTVKIEDIYDVDIFEDGLVGTIGEIISKLEK